MAENAKQNIFMLALAQALFLGCTVTNVTVISLVGQKLAPTPDLATLPYALVTVGVALSTVPASFFMKRFGRRAGFVSGAGLGVVSYSLGTIALFTGNFMLMCIAAMLQGVFQATASYYRFAAVETKSGFSPGKAISLVLAGGAIAAFIAPMGTRWMNAAFTDVQYSGPYFYMIILAVTIIIPLSMLKIPKPHDDETSGPQRSLSVILKQPATITAIFNGGAAWLLMVMIMGATPMAMHARGFHFDHSSQVIQWHVLGMYLPSLITGTLIERLGVLKLLTLGLLIIGVSAVVGYPGETLLHFGVSLALLGVGWNFLYVGATTLLTQTYTPAEKAKTQAANEFVVFTMATTGAFLSGYLLNTIGWQNLMQVTGIVLLLAASVTLWYASICRRGPDNKCDATLINLKD
jgi:MFS family permease